MSTITATGPRASEPVRKQPVLVPSVVSGLGLGLVAAIVVGIIVHGIASPLRDGDATLVAGYVAFAIFFLVGMGAFNFPVRWGLGGPDTSHEEELQNAGKDEGIWRYFRFCTDHKVVGVQYLMTVLVLFLVGGIASWMIRLEQAQSGAKVFTPATYNTIVGMHGIIMIATTIIMLTATFGNYIVPIMIGANDMAFPRLNALSFWTLFPAVPILLSAIVLGGFSTGWTGYAPLADQAALGMDAYCMTIILLGISIALSALNITATVVTMRAPGMTWTRIPVFVWSAVFSSLLGLVAFPAFMLAVTLTLLDRVFGTGFYESSLGGNNWAYEELFWFMGHPEVYVILLPAVGAICEIVPVFCRKPLFGYKLVVAAEVAIFVISLGVWMHHLYWSGANTALDTPIMLSTEIISIPTGLIFFALIGTIWRGRIRFEPPMLFACGFILNFLIGGITGLYLADVPTDTIYHGDMFVVAHFHFTLVGGTVFGFIAGFYYWFPKIFGKQLDRRLGALHFWLLEIGFLGVFLPLFYAGLQGEPRWQAFVASQFVTANKISSLFAIVLVASVAVFAYNLIMTWRSGKLALANEWGARTLEWLTTSPPPLINFERPVVVSSGPYDYGIAGARMMAAPAMAGGAVDVAVAGAPAAHPPAHDQALAVRIAVLLLIVSDAVFVGAMYVVFAYLHALHTQGQFKPSAEAKPSVVGSLLVTAASVAAASIYYWGQRGLRSGNGGRVRAGVMGAVVISLVALVGDVLVFGGLNYPSPLHAYGSFISLFILYHAVRHLVVGVLIGALVLGRLYSGRLAGRDYVIQVTGWWFTWIAFTAVLMLVLMLTIS
ncbi:MAG: cbb3-type cytochrome c oxidase subunit I [Solirubrobacteraceae bacterium]